MAKIPVYRKDNGEKVYVPEHRMDHKTLSKPFRKTPPPVKAEETKKAPATAGTTTKKED